MIDLLAATAEQFEIVAEAFGHEAGRRSDGLIGIALTFWAASLNASAGMLRTWEIVPGTRGPPAIAFAPSIAQDKMRTAH
jgi:hypothetical protein